MTKKHFQAIADALAYSKPIREVHVRSYQHRLKQWRVDVLGMVRVCNQFNGMFDQSRFLTACNYED